MSAAANEFRCLVLQFARLGDSLQSIMALRAIKQMYPMLSISVVVRKNYAAALRRVQWIDEVIEFSTDEQLGAFLNGSESRSEAVARLGDWLTPLVARSWDMVVNWSYSDASSFLTAILPARIKLGYSRNKDKSLGCADGWSCYFQAIVQGQVAQDIHLTDILTTQLLTALQFQLGEPMAASAMAVSADPFFRPSPMVDAKASPQESDYNIAIQLGSSEVAKNWSPESWADFVRQILIDFPKVKFWILGSASERFLEEKFFSKLVDDTISDVDLNRVVSLVGRTEFDDWNRVVSGCQWVFAADTSVIHLASLLGVKVLNLSLGNVRFRETGPYGNGHLVVRALCSEQVSPEFLLAIWHYSQLDRSRQMQQSLRAFLTEKLSPEFFLGLNVFKSRIRTPDTGGGVVYESLLDRTFGLEEWSAILIGRMARSWYCGWIPSIEQNPSWGQIDSVLIAEVRKLQEPLSVLKKVIEESIRTALQIHRKGSALRSEKIMSIEDRNSLQAMGARLLELDQLVERVGGVHPLFSAFVQLSKVLLHNLKGQTVSDMGKEASECYQQLKEGAELLDEWIAFTLAVSKPKELKAPSLRLVTGGKDAFQ